MILLLSLHFNQVTLFEDEMRIITNLLLLIYNAIWLCYS